MAKIIKMMRLNNHPASAIGAGIVSAPVPTIKLKTYIRPIYIKNKIKQNKHFPHMKC